MTLSRNQLIAALEATHPALVQLTAHLTDAQLDSRPAAAEWSLREILAHLVDDEMYVMRLRMERIVKEDEPHLTPHDEKKWFPNRNQSRDELGELLGDFLLQRSASLGMLQMLRETDWQRSGFQPEYGHFTGEGWLSRWVDHDTVHLAQIKKNLEQQ